MTKVRYFYDKFIRYLKLILQNRLFAFFILSIVYLELVYCLCIYKEIGLGFIFPILSSISAAAVLYLISSTFQTKINKYLSISLITLLSLVYSFYFVYHSIFKTTFSVYSFIGAKDALQFGSVIKSALTKNLIAIFLLAAPLLFLLIKINTFSFRKQSKNLRLSLAVLVLISFVFTLAFIQTTASKANSQYMLYYKISSPHLMVKKLGLITAIRLDIKRLIFGFNLRQGEMSYSDENFLETLFPKQATRKQPKIDTIKNYNLIDIPFIDLISKESNSTLLDMHKYFSSAKPTEQNEYTGMFRGDNLILLTAEAFYPYAMSPQLTPTLYKMANEGFVFGNFYTPLWGVSTSDGEYAVCTGLLPKAGVWSMSQSGKNRMALTLGNQFKRLGYTTKAYHNHTFNYYNRHISHPNLGYDYKGIGNGLRITPAWPESDFEMIDVTTPEYIDKSPFHIYYMTVSGHFEYNFDGNHMAIKNRRYVEDLPFSEAAKAYIACNLELESAMTELVERLEEQGIAEKTVIAISPDHYPYGLPKKDIDELSGHVVEDNFEIYKSSLILWKKGMSHIKVNKLCASVDILPTLSNLFGLEYDSRLMIGKDILSNSKPLIVFANRSWITERGRYNTLTNTFTGSVLNEQDYIETVNRAVESKFLYSARILENDYYQHVLP